MRIAALRLAAADPGGLRRFYSELMGVPPGPEDSLLAGGARLSFERAADGDRPIHHLAFGIPQNRFEEAHAWLGSRLPLLRDGDQDVFDFAFWNAHACYVLDPAGNVVELIAHHDLPTAAEGFRDGRDLTGIAEVGLPVPDVMAAVDELEGTLGLGTWDGDPPSPGFSAIGALGATFIVVPQGRNWYPTERPSGDWPMHVTVDGAPRAGTLQPSGTRVQITAG